MRSVRAESSYAELLLQAEAKAVEEAVNKVLDEGYRTADIMSEGMKPVKGSEMTKLIVERV